MKTLYCGAEVITVTVDGARADLCLARVEGSSQAHRADLGAVLLHGNPANLDDWRELAESLRQHAKLVAIDLPGFGRSDGLLSESDATRLDLYADFIATAVKHVMGSKPFYLIGHSHGAAVAQVLAARYPERVAGLVLLSSPGVRAHASYRILALPGARAMVALAAAMFRYAPARPLLRLALRAIMVSMFRPRPLPPKCVDEQLTAIVERPEVLRSMVLVARGGPCAQLRLVAPQIRAPVLLIHGDSDRLVPLAYAVELRDALSSCQGASFHVVVGGGHMIHRTDSEHVSALIGEWLRNRA